MWYVLIMYMHRYEPRPTICCSQIHIGAHRIGRCQHQIVMYNPCCRLLQNLPPTTHIMLFYFCVFTLPIVISHSSRRLLFCRLQMSLSAHASYPHYIIVFVLYHSVAIFHTNRGLPKTYRRHIRLGSFNSLYSHSKPCFCHHCGARLVVPA